LKIYKLSIKEARQKPCSIQQNDIANTASIGHIQHNNVANTFLAKVLTINRTTNVAVTGYRSYKATAAHKIFFMTKQLKT